MLVSVITTCFNSGKTIADTIRSVRAQTYKHIEHIIIDGGSTDDTLSIIRDCKHDGPLISEPDNGIYNAMNKGIKMAKGDVIGLLNSDDFYYDNMVVEKIVSTFLSKQCDAIYSDLVFVDPNRTDIIKRKWIAGIYEREKFLTGWMPPHPTVYIKRSIYKKYGAFNEQFKIAADYDLLLRFLFVHKVNIHYLKGISIRMRSGGRSTKNILNRIQAHREDRRAWKFNGAKPYWYTLFLKPLRKVKQFIVTNKKYA